MIATTSVSKRARKPAVLGPGIGPGEDRILPPKVLGLRWGTTSKVAMQRAKELGIPIIKFNERALGVRLSDVLTVEARLAA